MLKKYPQLSKFAKNLLSYTSLDEGLSYTSLNVKTMIAAERCSIFIYNREENVLWSKLADNAETIIVPFDLGIIGETIKIEKPIIENDPYGNTKFLSDIDMQSGFYTQNILTAPIFNQKNKIIGVIQLLNKKGDFNKEDIKILSFFANHIGDFIESK